SSWSGIVDGRSSILFAVLAGVSIAIISGGTRPVDGLLLVQARLRILVRAVIVFAIGGVLALLGTGIAIILEVYAVLFVLSLPFLRWSPRRLFIAAGIVAIVGPVLRILLVAVVTWASSELRPPVEMWSALYDYATGMYPAVIWLAFLLLGLGVGRLVIEALRVQLVLLAVGAGLAVVGYVLGALSAPLAFTVSDAGLGRMDRDPHALGPIVVQSSSALFGVLPHSGTTFEVVGSGGFAVAVIALCLLATRVRWLRVLLTPLASVGQMALTIYVAQVIAFWIIVIVIQRFPDDWGLFWCLAAVSLVLATIWRAFLGQGPLERLLSAASRRAAAVPTALLESPVRPGEGATAPSSTSSEENTPHG
ncbi:MAG: DUF418 domain-containing protein, partial [Microbacteriaceae bacterium]|nr:DUF418 domain-containing protein [Microbacteriaceae bacterium]